LPDPFDDILDQELGELPIAPEMTDELPGEEPAVKVAQGIPGKSSQSIVPWVEIKAHSSEDAQVLVAKLKNASINYPDITYKQNGTTVVAHIDPIPVEIPYINGILRVASEHGVAEATKNFQVVDSQ